jgi:hypothetical protein
LTRTFQFMHSDDLTPRERDLLSNETWSISANLLWEIALSELGSIEFDLEHPKLASNIGAD